MPIEYVMYDDQEQEIGRGEAGALQLTMVGDGEFTLPGGTTKIDLLDLIYTDPTGGGFPTNSFVLTTTNNQYSYAEVTPTTEPERADPCRFHVPATQPPNGHELHFGPPLDSTVTTFHTSTKKISPTKLRVKVRRQTETLD